MPIPGLRVVAVEDGHADWIRLGPDQDPETSHQHTGRHVAHRRSYTDGGNDLSMQQAGTHMAMQLAGCDRSPATGSHPASRRRSGTGDASREPTASAQLCSRAHRRSQAPTAARHRQRFVEHRRVARSGRVTGYRSGHRKSVVYPWNVFLVVLDKCRISSRRKRRAGKRLPRVLKRRA